MKCFQGDVTEIGLTDAIVITFLIFTSELDNREFRYLIGFQIHESGRGPETYQGNGLAGVSDDPDER